ncbi:lipase [Mycolicibacterium farcinogenes]|uniref:Secretory lipase family protein n=2 Tax=Mycobacteriaceae TaxID=1762 RepID=A0A378W8R5_9MYCO|nr:lipase [Mycolicibacterium farcinogenes]SUA28510.1 Putative secretory lipase family protein [Mycolicibacterium senegalense]
MLLHAMVVIAVLTTMMAAAPLPHSAADECPPNNGYQPECQYRPFYTPPDPLPTGAPGDLIRTEPSRIALDPAGHGNYSGRGTRIMYLSTNLRGETVPVTGTYLEPDRPWTGRGPRPLIAFAPWAQGLGDQCATSRLLSEGGFHYGGYLDFAFYFEEGFLATMLDRGFAIVATDYQGTGTYTPPTTGIRIPTAHAVIDAVRAAKRLPGTSLDPLGPVGIWGYGPGGTAAGAAVEMAPSYAPELDVVGAWVGAPLADYADYADYADGSMLVGTMGMALNAFVAAVPEAEQGMRAMLTPRGLDFLDKTRYACTDEIILKFMFRHLQPYFVSDFREILATEPIKSALAAQRLGSLRPSAPIQIVINRWDPLFPWVGARQLAVDWCAKGADVEFWTNEQPPFLNKTGANSLLTAFVEGEHGLRWIADRFNGSPTSPNCSALPPLDPAG